MRISCLLMVLLVGLVSVCAAGDGARQSSSSQAAVNSFSADWFDSSAIAHYDLDHHRLDSARNRDGICYTIQNFRVKRDRYSDVTDVTVPFEYSYCLPSWKYSVRKVEESGKAPSR